ncbi:hypothetical protein VXQ00_18245 [Acinetobacter baumannii]|uniref:hypothetical protein n=1 Tax=Acinetobacter baumannii TaxID=470 RepID=UPI00355B7915
MQQSPSSAKLLALLALLAMASAKRPLQYNYTPILQALYLSSYLHFYIPILLHNNIESYL